MHEVSLFRLYLMRVLYGLMAFVMGSEQWRLLIEIGTDRSLMQGVAHGMLAALALISILGLWRPLQMLPILFFEFAWKAVWLVGIALPLSLEGRLPENFRETAFACLFGVVLVPIVIPWRYVAEHYFKNSADRWW